MSNPGKRHRALRQDAEPYVLQEFSAGELQHAGAVCALSRVIRSAEDSTFSIEEFDLYDVIDDDKIPGNEEELPVHTASKEMSAAVASGRGVILEADKEMSESDWQQKAAALLEQAQHDAEQYRTEAQQHAQAIREEAYQVGFEQGVEAAQQETAAQFATLFATLQQAGNELVAVRTRTLQQAEDDIVALAFRLAEKIVHVTCNTDPAVVAITLRRALAHLIDRGQMTVWVHPADLEQARALQQECLEQCGPGTTIQIQADDMVERGGCLIDSAFGTIDARITAQLDELEQRIRESRSGEASA